MRAYISIKYRADNSNRNCIEKIASALEQNGFETVCITRDIEKWGQIELSPEELMQRTFSEIDLSHLIVIDLTEKGVGLGIEAGYAYAKGNPYCSNRKEGVPIFPQHYRAFRSNCFCMMNSMILRTFSEIQPCLAIK